MSEKPMGTRMAEAEAKLAALEAEVQALRAGRPATTATLGPGPFSTFVWWGCALTAEEVHALQAGVDPRVIRPEALRVYRPALPRGSVFEAFVGVVPAVYPGSDPT